MPCHRSLRPDRRLDSRRAGRGQPFHRDPGRLGASADLVGRARHRRHARHDAGVAAAARALRRPVSVAPAADVSVRRAVGARLAHRVRSRQDLADGSGVRRRDRRVARANRRQCRGARRRQSRLVAELGRDRSERAAAADQSPRRPAERSAARADGRRQTPRALDAQQLGAAGREPHLRRAGRLRQLGSLPDARHAVVDDAVPL